MRSYVIALVLAAACATKNDDTPGSQDTEPTVDDTDVVDDTGEDTADTDTGPDDTGPDTGPDTADTADTSDTVDTSEAACSIDDLEYDLQIRGADGMEADTFAPDDLPTLAALVVNGCSDGPLTFTTDESCLVERWEITGPDGQMQEVEPLCTVESTTWNLTADGTQETTYRLEALPEGDYDVEVFFALRGETASASFTVEAAESPAE